jgi:hypothetical protein
VVITPALLLLLTLIVQMVAWEHAHQIAHMAAQSGVDAARVEGGSLADGRVSADGVIARAGAGVVLNPVVSATRTGDTVYVNVTGAAPQLIPWLHLSVHEVAVGPVERFSTPGGSP